MADPVLVSDLVTYSRQRSNMEASQFVTDPEFVSYLNRAYKALYDLLVETFEDYAQNTYSFNLSPPTTSYPLPDDFYKLQGVDLKVDSNQTITLTKYMFNERNMFRNMPYSSIYVPYQYLYRTVGNNIQFISIPTTGSLITLFYAPVPKTLTTSLTPGPTEQNTIDAINGYDEYCILSAAKMALIKEESDFSGIQTMLDSTTARIKSMAPNRDSGMPEHVTDIYAVNAANNWPFRMGGW